MELSDSCVRIVNGINHIDKLILSNNFYVSDDDNNDNIKLLEIGTIEELVINSIRKYQSNEYLRLIEKVVNGGVVELHNMTFVRIDNDCISRFSKVIINGCIIIDDNLLRDDNLFIFKTFECIKYHFKDDGNYSGMGYYNENMFNKNGYGIMKYDCGNIYDGKWNNNMKCGYGTMKYVNKNIYKGNWNNDMKCGYGMMFYNCIESNGYIVSHDRIYYGKWKDDNLV